MKTAKKSKTAQKRELAAEVPLTVDSAMLLNLFLDVPKPNLKTFLRQSEEGKMKGYMDTGHLIFIGDRFLLADDGKPIGKPVGTFQISLLYDVIAFFAKLPTVQDEVEIYAEDDKPIQLVLKYRDRDKTDEQKQIVIALAPRVKEEE